MLKMELAFAFILFNEANMLVEFYDIWLNWWRFLLHNLNLEKIKFYNDTVKKAQ